MLTCIYIHIHISIYTHFHHNYMSRYLQNIYIYIHYNSPYDVLWFSIDFQWFLTLGPPPPAPSGDGGRAPRGSHAHARATGARATRAGASGAGHFFVETCGKIDIFARDFWDVWGIFSGQMWKKYRKMNICFDGFLRFLEGFPGKMAARSPSIFIRGGFLMDSSREYFLHCPLVVMTWLPSLLVKYGEIQNSWSHSVTFVWPIFHRFGCPIPDRQVASSSHSERHSLGNLLAQNQHLAARVGRTQGELSGWSLV